MKHIILGTAGHVDHGKTALIKALTGFDCDTHPEEKRRGITINLGFAHLCLEDQKIGIIDVPGHKDFIHTMVAGASGIDIALLVVAADDSVMPQTREHLEIMDMLGIKTGIVALTKADLVDQETIAATREEIKELTEGTFLQSCPIVPVSAVTKIGLDELRVRISDLTGKIEQRKQGEKFRMFIDRIFNVKGFGTVVTGSVLSGKTSVGDDLFLIPGKDSLRVRRLERFGIEVGEVCAGDRASINLVGFSLNDFKRGQVLSSTKLQTASMIDAVIRFQIDRVKPNTWMQTIFLLGTFETEARIHCLGDVDDTTFCQMHLGKPCTILNYDRFVIRSSSGDTTLGGGEVIDTNPLHHKRKRPELLEFLKKLYAGEIKNPDEFKRPRKEILHNEVLLPSIDNQKALLVEKILVEYGMQTPLMAEMLPKAKILGLDEKGLKQILHHLIGQKKAYIIDNNYFHAGIVDGCREKLKTALRDKTEGMTVAEFRNLIGGNRKICLLLLSRYDSEGTTMRIGDKRILKKQG